MISREYMERLGLTEDQISAVGDAMKEESRFRRLLFRSGIAFGAVDPIVRATSIEDVRSQSDDLLTEKIKAEYPDLIMKKKCQI